MGVARRMCMDVEERGCIDSKGVGSGGKRPFSQGGLSGWRAWRRIGVRSKEEFSWQGGQGRAGWLLARGGRGGKRCRPCWNPPGGCLGACGRLCVAREGAETGGTGSRRVSAGRGLSLGVRVDGLGCLADGTELPWHWNPRPRGWQAAARPPDGQRRRTAGNWPLPCYVCMDAKGSCFSCMRIVFRFACMILRTVEGW